MPIIDQSDVVVANNAAKAVIEELRMIPNTDIIFARVAKQERRAKFLEDIQAYEHLQEMSEDQRRQLAIAKVQKTAAEEGYESAMDARLNQLDTKLYDVIDNAFAAKLKELKQIRDEFVEAGE